MHDIGRHGQAVPSSLFLAHFGDEIGNPSLGIQRNYLYHAAATFFRNELSHANILERLHVIIDIIGILDLILLIALASLDNDECAIVTLELHVSREKTTG